MHATFATHKRDPIALNPGDRDGGAPPMFDAERFGARLKRQMAADGVTILALSQAAGLSYGTVQQLGKGVPTNSERTRKGQTGLSPSLTSIARIAHGLSLDFAYVASWGGIESGDRWDNFTQADRRKLAALLGGQPADDLDALLRAAPDPASASRENA